MSLPRVRQDLPDVRRYSGYDAPIA